MSPNGPEGQENQHISRKDWSTAVLGAAISIPAGILTTLLVLLFGLRHGSEVSLVMACLLILRFGRQDWFVIVREPSSIQIPGSPPVVEKPRTRESWRAWLVAIVCMTVFTIACDQAYVGVNSSAALYFTKVRPPTAPQPPSIPEFALSLPPKSRAVDAGDRATDVTRDAESEELVDWLDISVEFVPSAEMLAHLSRTGDTRGIYWDSVAPSSAALSAWASSAGRLFICDAANGIRSSATFVFGGRPSLSMTVRSWPTNERCTVTVSVASSIGAREIQFPGFYLDLPTRFDDTIGFRIPPLRGELLTTLFPVGLPNRKALLAKPRTYPFMSIQHFRRIAIDGREGYTMLPFGLDWWQNQGAKIHDQLLPPAAKLVVGFNPKTYVRTCKIAPWPWRPNPSVDFSWQCPFADERVEIRRQ